MAINGIYEGYNVDEPNNPFDVEIMFEGGNRGMVMYNINRGCFVPQNKLPFSYYRLDFSNYCILFNGVAYGEGCEYPSGRGILDINTRTIVIDYEAGPQNDRKIYKFIGVKKWENTKLEILLISLTNKFMKISPYAEARYLRNLYKK